MSSHKAAPVIPDPKGYESEDIDLKPIVKWMVYLQVFTLTSALITLPIYYFYLPKTTVGDVTRFDKHAYPQGTPVLQALPKVEMKDFRMGEQEKAEGYGWADKSKGAVRIPIEKAMELVTEKGADGVVVGTPPAEKVAEPVGKDAPEIDKPVLPETGAGEQPQH